MLLLTLERINGDYILRIPKHDVVQHDLHEGQVLAVLFEPLDDFGTIGVETTDRCVESWKLNEPGQRYEPDN